MRVYSALAHRQIERRATVERLCSELGSLAYSPNQYANPDNAGAHIKSTGPELLEQMEGNLDALFIPISTGGQIDGIGRFMKEHLPTCRIIGTEPVGSTILAEVPGDYYNAGSGLDYAPAPVERMLNDDLIDESWTIPDAASFKATRMAARYTAALCGPSTGMQLFGAIALAIEDPSMKRIALIGCDDGRAYLRDVMQSREADEMDTVDEFEERIEDYLCSKDHQHRFRNNVETIQVAAGAESM